VTADRLVDTVVLVAEVLDVIRGLAHHEGLRTVAC
jgi:hypothetical protein